MSGDLRMFDLRIVGELAPGGGRRVVVYATLKDGSLFPVTAHTWPGGGISPAGLELIRAAADDEIQTAILSWCGFQGDFEGMR